MLKSAEYNSVRGLQSDKIILVWDAVGAWHLKVAREQGISPDNTISFVVEKIGEEIVCYSSNHTIEIQQLIGTHYIAENYHLLYQSSY